MLNTNILDYPKYLNKIFDKLNNNNIISIIVGGYVRDSLLGISSKDIDIELYGVRSYFQLEEILQEFGSVNNVGKSFGVCKLSLDTVEIDFTLPRHDNKVGSGHSGFLVVTDKNLDFTTASSRRDFTMNAIGFDIQKKVFLDPFNGIDAINHKLIKAVDLQTFGDDPLRVFRAISFASRLNFTLDDKLFLLCKEMCEKNILSELAQERTYDEVKKILLKSSSPSVAFLLLQKLNGLRYLHPLDTIDETDFLSILQALDRVKKNAKYNNTTNIFLFLSVLCHKFNKEKINIFILRLTTKKMLALNIYAMISQKFQSLYSDSELLYLATKVNIELFLIVSQALYPNIPESIYTKIKQRALALNILNVQQEAFLKGRDLLILGLEPSKEYSEILSLAYQKQLKLEILNHTEATQWLKQYLGV